ncbi:BgTH12-02041 [Blumeria graminis f. sp. triticale]|uniref:Bgt-20932-2 n=2 Tax=Blumeria graminis TaxID=34373 RepID=A0A9X9MFY6_BLUGR|nr:BgTH12-02041 [Blumeria graminis f. sp. triticale]VDB84442.1 Bgt-20932-2 [Blumeria graminis f. sp. tritici]
MPVDNTTVISKPEPEFFALTPVERLVKEAWPQALLAHEINHKAYTSIKNKVVIRKNIIFARKLCSVPRCSYHQFDIVIIIFTSSLPSYYLFASRAPTWRVWVLVWVNPAVSTRRKMRLWPQQITAAERRQLQRIETLKTWGNYQNRLD